MNNDSLFQFATRNKIRFASSRGDLSVEQLWDVPLRSKDAFNLDEIAKYVNRALKNAIEESFIETNHNPERDRLEVTLEVVKHVIGVRIDEENAAKKKAANKAEKTKLLAILAEKQDGKLSSLSEAELKRRIAALGSE
jgi:hypothetical protein